MQGRKVLGSRSRRVNINFLRMWPEIFDERVKSNRETGLVSNLLLMHLREG